MQLLDRTDLRNLSLQFPEWPSGPQTLPGARTGCETTVCLCLLELVTGKLNLNKKNSESS